MPSRVALINERCYRWKARRGWLLLGRRGGGREWLERLCPKPPLQRHGGEHYANDLTTLRARHIIGRRSSIDTRDGETSGLLFKRWMDQNPFESFSKAIEEIKEERDRGVASGELTVGDFTQA